MKRHNPTSWQKVSRWYHEKQGAKGSYFYERLILPKTLSLMNLAKTDSVLDLGCGQGILEKQIGPGISYVGIDLSRDLVNLAKNTRRSPRHEFWVGDITRPLPISAKRQFSKLAVILALQNVHNLGGLVTNIGKHLAENGSAVIVINHPYFRIPRQTSWQTDENNKLQYRRINRYYTSFKIPVEMHPGRKEGTVTWSFHYPLWQLSEELSRNRLVITKIEEWVSERKSVGKASKMENFARAEFPLFMALLVEKKS